MTGRMTREDVVRRIRLVGSAPVVTGDPIVLHWVGSPKPRIRQRGRDYFLPMTYFRHELRRAARGGSSRFRDDLRLRVEDMLCSDWRGTNARGRVARLLRRARQRYATYKVSFRRRTPNPVVAFVFRRSPAPDQEI